LVLFYASTYGNVQRQNISPARDLMCHRLFFCWVFDYCAIYVITCILLRYYQDDEFAKRAERDDFSLGNRPPIFVNGFAGC